MKNDTDIPTLNAQRADFGFNRAGGESWADDDIQLNTDVLDTQDKSNIDLSHFSRRGYVMPGDYTFSIMVNKDIPARRANCGLSRWVKTAGTA